MEKIVEIQGSNGCGKVGGVSVIKYVGKWSFAHKC